MLKTQLTCIFCHEPVLILYQFQRDKKQWTLDRINNDLAHTQNNVEICCLECNLKRRRIQYKAFAFSRQLKIVKNQEQE